MGCPLRHPHGDTSEATSFPEHTHRRLVPSKLHLQHRISCRSPDGELQQKLCHKEGEIPFGNDVFPTQHSTVLTLSPMRAGRAPRPRPSRSLEGKLHRPLAQHGGSSATGGSPQSGLRVQAPALGAERRAPREFALRFSINCLQ